MIHMFQLVCFDSAKLALSKVGKRSSPPSDPQKFEREAEPNLACNRNQHCYDRLELCKGAPGATANYVDGR